MTTFKTVTINCDWNLIGIPYVSGCPGWYETGSGSVLETLSSVRDLLALGWGVDDGPR